MLTHKLGAAPSKSTKSSYKPRITPISTNEYVMPSERYSGYILYKVTVHQNGRAQCECRASDFGRLCKHSRLALAAHAYRCNPSHIRSAAPVAALPVTSAAGLLAAFGVA